MRKFSGRLRKADAFGRWSFTEIEPQGLLREQVWHIYLIKGNLLQKNSLGSISVAIPASGEGARAQFPNNGW